MRKPVLLLASLAFTCILAQPTFQAADLTPPIGAVLTARGTPYYWEAGPTGSNFVFDASAVDLGVVTTLEYFDPATTPYAATFPGASYAQVTGLIPSHFTYYEITPTAIIFRGSESGNGTFTPLDTARMAVFPLSLGTSWYDTYSSVGTASGNVWQQNNTYAGAYNGFGTLMLPFGIFTDVARLETTATAAMVVPGPLPITVNQVSYYTLGLPYPLLTTYYELSGTDTVRVGTSVIDPIMLGIREVPSKITGSLAPNPANGLTTLTLSTGTVAGLEIRVFDAVGRVVRTLQPSTGQRQCAIDMAGIAPGLYMVRATEPTGATGSWSLVVE